MLTGKTAIVTGASRGIGKAIALELASQGANVIVNYAGNKQKADEVVNAIKELGRNSMSIQADVSNENDVKEMIKVVKEQFDTIDILVNNAGVTRDNLLLRMNETEWDDVIETNLKGVYLCIKSVARQMMKQRNGRIINLASVVGISGNAGQANYVAAKAGVIGLTKSCAKEFASRNITVNAVAPGFIVTDMTEKLPENVQNQMLNEIPLKRFGDPKDVAHIVSFLASENSGYITGQTIQVDGGMVM
ncbi:3-oxoacyl-[acyl-carrier-protein] reductase [Bacillus carboniphilus]|uniref:3-oxoacyl-[acyl-carrier-protein] reductase n=1 Tax=Bacillus carboniphilus TaxID=86663 RepID=A0ABY9JVY4_9BACI|nr:3-oxoacyl-[acyl-carrier-protein] reductase [Bacillus carboniphilus]WLR43564.1 3-oxoacyl-[acyl-carrier-protein] reductase [Bacillus carboniphilus]